ncbi:MULTISPECIES: phenylacetate--CoA ligase family protein [unclassified Streptococcus]|uniref:phenylacetate--CoA ligase family protein n=1 Tax=unclassified Streptococcus TaxID=2608887 RepID=UPI0004514A2F|nr:MULTISPECIES: phenylacetate--CoA ligase family protein [unclassified Streptococcus]EUB18526.1 hypothetical protein HMPREF1510_1108 [Streptococcus sp. ACC21]EWC98041.1 hypothetical protein HMPREF1509_1692 [Streptococcus sp. AC15]
MTNNFINKNFSQDLYFKENSSTIYEFFKSKRRQYSHYEIEKYQEKRYIRLINIAKKVPFYKEIIETLKLEESTNIRDLSKFPILEKEDLRKNFIKLVNPEADLKDCYRNRTSGSTAQPITNLHNVKEHQMIHSINVMRQRDAWKIDECERMLMIIPERFLEGFPEYPDYVIDMNGLIKVWGINPQKYNDIISILNDVKPDIIYGNPFLISYVLDKVEKSDLKYHCPKFFYSSFELLSEGLRKRIKTNFNCEVCDIYGFSEVGDIAWECPVSKNYHINEDFYYLETIDKSGKNIEGSIGDIVVTSLHNSAMPLIRYRVGDCGILIPGEEVCACGRKTRCLQKIVGRSVDFLKNEEGDSFSPYDVMTILERYRAKKFKILQEDFNRCKVFIQIDDEVNLLKIQEELEELFNNTITPEIISVDNLLITSISEKFRPVESKLR